MPIHEDSHSTTVAMLSAVTVELGGKTAHDARGKFTGGGGGGHVRKWAEDHLAQLHPMVKPPHGLTGSAKIAKGYATDANHKGQKADSWSKLAKETNREAHHRTASTFHEQAKNAHALTSELFKSHGDHQSATKHADLAERHAGLAQNHRQHVG